MVHVFHYYNTLKICLSLSCLAFLDTINLKKILHISWQYIILHTSVDMPLFLQIYTVKHHVWILLLNAFKPLAKSRGQSTEFSVNITFAIAIPPTWKIAFAECLVHVMLTQTLMPSKNHVAIAIVWCTSPQAGWTVVHPSAKLI